MKSELKSQFLSIDTLTNEDISPRMAIQDRDEEYMFEPSKISTLDDFKLHDNLNNYFLPTDYLNSCSSQNSNHMYDRQSIYTAQKLGLNQNISHLNSKTSLFTNNTKSDFLKHKDIYLKARKER